MKLKLLITTQLRCIRSMSTLKMNNSGIIVIGDEILKGNVVDSNSNYITQQLYNLGVQVKKISVIGDNVQEICDEVQLFSKKYTYVITTGGIGPTHDDVTFEGVAKAFNQNLVYHPVLVKICAEFYKTDDLKAAGMKLAHIPESAKLIFGDQSSMKAKYPLVNVKNVYIFPGIPQLMKRAFELFGGFCFSSKLTFHKKEIYLNVSEANIVRILNEVVQKFPNVVFGSYPVLQNQTYQVRITIESVEKDTVEKAYNTLLNALPKDYLVSD